jgi:hypothetical protein
LSLERTHLALERQLQADRTHPRARDALKARGSVHLITEMFAFFHNLEAYFDRLEPSLSAPAIGSYADMDLESQFEQVRRFTAGLQSIRGTLSEVTNSLQPEAVKTNTEVPHSMHLSGADSNISLPNLFSQGLERMRVAFTSAGNPDQSE